MGILGDDADPPLFLKPLPKVQQVQEEEDTPKSNDLQNQNQMPQIRCDVRFAITQNLSFKITKLLLFAEISLEICKTLEICDDAKFLVQNTSIAYIRRHFTCHLI